MMNLDFRDNRLALPSLELRPKSSRSSMQGWRLASDGMEVLVVEASVTFPILSILVRLPSLCLGIFKKKMEAG